jgi:hypothetical protein
MMPVRFNVILSTTAAALAVIALSEPTIAAFGISSISGATQTVAPPGVLPGPGPFSTESVLPIIFPEVLGGTLAAPLPVDHNGSNIVSPGAAVNANSVVNSAFVSAVLPQGKKYNSYLFHFDPLINSVPFYISTITFTNQVIGVQLFSNGYTTLQKPLNTPYVGTLEAGDAAVGGPVVYPTGVSYRGLDEDEFALVISNNQVSLMGIALGGQIDQVRILTAVPEPTTFAVWGLISLACGCVAFYRRSSFNSH